MSKYGGFPGPYFHAFGLNTERYGVFSLNAGKYGPKKPLYLDTFHAVIELTNFMKTLEKFYLKPKGIIWSSQAFLIVIMIFSKLMSKRKVIN